jgi:predicted extracellular nuclease
VDRGDAVLVSGLVAEVRLDDDAQNLTITEIINPSVEVVGSNLLATIDPVALGEGGRLPPSAVIDDDAAGSVEAPGVLFDPAADGLDFWESLEGMLVAFDDALVVGPKLDDGEAPLVVGGGADASTLSPRGGLVIGAGAAGPDLNPEMLFLDDTLLSAVDRFPALNTGDRIDEPVVGVVDYAFRRFRVLPSDPVEFTLNDLTPELASAAGEDDLAIATFNVENLDAEEAETSDRFARLAEIVVDNLGEAGDLLVLEEVQDNTGRLNDGEVEANETYGALIAAIAAAGGPEYEFRDIPPRNGRDGGQPGGNIRVGFLFRPDRGLSFVDRPGGDATTPVQIVPGADPELSISPGRILADPANPTADGAFANSRKPLVGEFVFNGRTLFVVGAHFASRQDSTALFGPRQPPAQGGGSSRQEQAEIVAAFVEDLLAADPEALVVVAGDMNEFQFARPLATLEEAGLTNLTETLPAEERYTYIFEGNSQAIDHIFVSDVLAEALAADSADIVHVNAEYAEQASDHDPQVARFTLPAQ